ncbi:Ig-like domain-containing protein [Clostridium sp. WILCCON 0269]|uniref:Ig-like domain-containing protein n=1 Tax=Candidatus Clostridium eludens TaxID=3381663 RepID=A0ABW8SFB3_9CLOT
MKKFIKNLVIFCIVYILAQSFHYKIALASNNGDNPSTVSYTTTEEVSPNQSENSDSLSEDSNVDTQSSNDTTGKEQIQSQNTVSETSTYYNESSSSSSTEDIAQKNTAEKTTAAGDEDTTYNTLTKYNVSLNKEWKITFNQPVDIDSLKDNIKLVDKNNTEIPITLSSEDNGTSVIITPEKAYSAETEYTLTVGKDIVSRYNKKLKNPTIVEFKTSPSIVSIDDINVTINQEDEYSLPTEVTAKMSNDSTTSVGVSWDKSVDRTSIPGNYTYTGTVDGYNKAVTLNLTINPFEPVESISNEYRTQSSIGTNLYNYLMNYDNRQSVLNKAIELHNGDTSNNCVYFASEALRRAGLTDLPNYVANTVTLTSQLQSRGWQTSTDLSMLLPGDICFTTSYGYGPTHTYTFMKWVDPNSHDYGYICDNQGYDYGYNDYHKRNINIATSEKDAISYFMYLPT